MSQSYFEGTINNVVRNKNTDVDEFKEVDMAVYTAHDDTDTVNSEVRLYLDNKEYVFDEQNAKEFLQGMKYLMEYLEKIYHIEE